MKKIILLTFLLASTVFSELLPLSKKNINKNRDSQFTRGTYLIVLSNSDLNNATYFDSFVDFLFFLLLGIQDYLRSKLHFL